MNSRERQVAARHIGVLSKTRREELLLEQEKALQKEQEKKKPVDKKNPWGTVAESWAIETRGRIGTDFDDYLEAYQRERKAKKDWDDPVEDDNFGKNLKTGGIRDRLGWSRKMQDDDVDKDDEDMEWDIKMKKPRMGMVADIVERDSVKNRLGGGGLDFVRRKDPRKSDDHEVFQDLRQKVGAGERVIRTAGRRLNDRFSGGRLEGRLGGASAHAQKRDHDEPRDNRLRSRLGDRLGSRRHDVIDIDDSDERDSLEMDMGNDLKVELIAGFSGKEKLQLTKQGLLTSINYLPIRPISTLKNRPVCRPYHEVCQLYCAVCWLHKTLMGTLGDAWCG